jgi:hypothetical protein
MTDAGETQTMLRRTLIAVGAMLGASFLFVAALTIVLTVIADKAVAPSQGDESRAASTAPAGGAPAPGIRPAPAVKTTGGRS